MKKNVITLGLLALCVSIAHAQILDINSYVKSKIEIYNNENDVDVIEKLHKELTNLRNHEGNYEEEVFLTLENLIVTDIADLAPDTNESKKQVYLLLSEQNKKNTSYMDGKKLKKLDSAYLTSIADLKCRFIDYLAKQENYEESMFAEDLYKQAIKNDKKNTLAYIGYGTWLYFAPPIVGGGIDSCHEKFTQAVDKAQSPNLKYLALLYYSQSLFALGEYDLYEEALDEAYSIIGKDGMIESMRELNEKDLLFFE